MTQHRLLGIFAHPDDESFGAGGTLARYARAGMGVHVCTVTDGAGGSNESDAVQANADLSLADLRQLELECACRALGVSLWSLGYRYRDSGMEGSPDNQHPSSLYQADLEDVARDLVRVMREVRPHVIITHDPTGGYSHPDHIKVSRAVGRAWELVADGHAFPDLVADGYMAWQPARLYYLVIPRSTIRWVIFFVRLSGKNPRRFGKNHDVDLTRFGVPDSQIDVRLDVREYVNIKEKASRCHQSQGGGAHAWPRFLGQRALRWESFVQAYPPDAAPHRDLFEGLEHAEE